jgi:hypothetical protein
MRLRFPGFVFALLCVGAAAGANEPPAIEHQPAVCTVPGSAISMCAAVSDDSSVAVARAYFRAVGEKYFAYVNMSFTGLSYCATLPAPLKKTMAIEYYLQAIDDAGEPMRSSTYRLPVQPDTECSFPPLEKDGARAAAIEVFATNQKQGKKLDDGFQATGVTFVPAK